MRRQARPFVVEVKQKRGHQKRNPSIWGDLDLSALAAETKMASEAAELPIIQLVDTGLASVETEERYKPRTEHEMAEPKDAASMQTSTDVPATTEGSETKPEAKKKTAGSKVAKPKRTPQMSDADPSTVPTKRKVYSSTERTSKLDQIEKSIGRGDSVRNATKQAGISEQTYYQWKKVAEPSSESDDLKDLLALEEENKRLKSLLAKRLRKENAELKRKLGLE